MHVAPRVLCGWLGILGGSALSFACGQPESDCKADCRESWITDDDPIGTTTGSTSTTGDTDVSATGDATAADSSGATEPGSDGSSVEGTSSEATTGDPGTDATGTSTGDGGSSSSGAIDPTG